MYRSESREGGTVQHDGNLDVLRVLRNAAQQVRQLTAQTLGTTAVMAGSFLAKKILETIPEPTSVHDTMPRTKAPEASPPRAKTSKQRAA
jgi:hypothetical protein